jgi:hypothetical protein
MQGAVKIIKVPDGEFPLEVRKAGVGCELPYYSIEELQGHEHKGVITGTPGEIGTYCLVDQEAAIKALEQENPRAGILVRAMGFPHPDSSFVFRRDDVEVIRELVRLIRVYDKMETIHGNPDGLK